MEPFPPLPELPAPTPEQENLLRSQPISKERPGVILKDFETFIDFIGEKGLEVSGKHKMIGGRKLPALGARLSYPTSVPPGRPTQRDFPYVHALYLLARAAGFTFTEERGRKSMLLLRPAMVAAWKELNPVEQYLNLFAAWIMRLDDEPVPGDPGVDPLLALYFCFTFLNENRDNGVVDVSDGEEMNIPFDIPPGRSNIALMRLFGFLNAESVTDEEDGDYYLFEPSPFGEALVAVLAAEDPEDFIKHIPDDDTVDWEARLLQEALKPYFPAWERLLPLPTERFREGVFVFKVTLEDAWRRIAVPATASLDVLANAILRAFRFDQDHLYSFTFTDPFGLLAEVNHPRAEEPPFTDEMLVGEVPLPEGQTMTFVYDFGDWWEFDLLLERIEPKQPKMSRPILLDKQGKAPKQYPGW